MGVTARRRRTPTVTYVITGLAAGDYRVQFSAPMGSNLVSEYHPDTTNYSLAVPVKVAAGAIGDGDRCVVGGWRFDHGACHRQQRPAGAGRQRVGQFDRNDWWRLWSATTDANGDYVITGLVAGDYRVQFSAPMGSNLVSEYHPDTTNYSLAVPVTVAAGAIGDGDRCVVGGWWFDHRACHRQQRSTGAGCQRVGHVRPR